MVVILVMMQLAKKIPFDNPDILMLVRGLYVLSNLIILSIYLYTQKKINTKKGMNHFCTLCDRYGMQCFEQILTS